MSPERDTDRSTNSPFAAPPAPAKWETAVWRPFVSEHPERRPRFSTPAGIELPPTFAARGDETGPGEFPFTRGIYPSMYRGRLWTMRQYAGFAAPRDSNERFRYLLAQGQNGLSVAFDLPTQIGYDADDPEAAGEVGRVGVSISTLDHLDELFHEIPLDRVSISMTINATAPILYAMLLALAKRRGLVPAALRGTIQNDILKEFIARGTQRYPVLPSLRLAIDVIEYAVRATPNFNPISVSGYHIREAGATAIEELAFTLADGIAYLEQCRSRALDLAAIGRRISFFFNAHNYLFEEVAKFRAARRLWAEICRERFGLEDPEACRLRFHTQTAGSTLTAQEPSNNVVRVAMQALAAVLGGTQSLHANGADEALSLPTASSAKLALRTQQILADETGVADVADPLGGCPYVEHLTDRLGAEASRLIREIDARGGMVAAIESGFVRRRIEASAYEAQRAIEEGIRPQVGVERGGTIPEAPFRVDPSVEAERRASLGAHRARRDERAAAARIAALEEQARRGGNLVAPLVAAFEAGATLGEASRAFAGVFGEYQDV
ncbi:MAG: methylmalonyl-CoA mutase family protein [Planctomycetes bacterium]|nr:methylmalonyl-CoA mutase family protein [Planctomycetota bacterium]